MRKSIIARVDPISDCLTHRRSLIIYMKAELSPGGSHLCDLLGSEAASQLAFCTPISKMSCETRQSGFNLSGGFWSPPAHLQ